MLTKTEGTETLYFYPGLGWVTKARLEQSDMLDAEKIKEFDCNLENSGKCSGCPHNVGSSDWGGNRPCGQQHCWVDVTCREDEKR